MPDPHLGISLLGLGTLGPRASPLCAFRNVILPPVGSARDKGTVPTCGVARVCPLLRGGHWQKLSPSAPTSVGHLLLISSLTVAHHKTDREMFPSHDFSFGHCQHPQREECEKPRHSLNEERLGRNKPPQAVLSCLFGCPKAVSQDLGPGPRSVLHDDLGEKEKLNLDRSKAALGFCSLCADCTNTEDPTQIWLSSKIVFQQMFPKVSSKGSFFFSL